MVRQQRWECARNHPLLAKHLNSLAHLVAGGVRAVLLLVRAYCKGMKGKVMNLDLFSATLLFILVAYTGDLLSPKFLAVLELVALAPQQVRAFALLKCMPASIIQIRSQSR